MKKVEIVTDSTCDLPIDVVEKYGIIVVPESFVWDGVTYKDGIDLEPGAFYNRLVNSKTIPTTSQPSPAEFLEVYKPLEEAGSDILSLHISSKLSGTLDSAIQASGFIEKTNIKVFDSYSASLGLGFPVLAAAKAACSGASLQECFDIAETVKESTSVGFVIDTLEYLRKGGRIGGAAALLGTALRIKPILGVKDGRIEVSEKVRTFNKSLDRMIEIVLGQADKTKKLNIGVIQVEAKEEAESVLERVIASFKPEMLGEVFVIRATPVIGIHTGPGTIGLVVSPAV